MAFTIKGGTNNTAIVTVRIKNEKGDLKPAAFKCAKMNRFVKEHLNRGNRIIKSLADKVQRDGAFMVFQVELAFAHPIASAI